MKFDQHFKKLLSTIVFLLAASGAQSAAAQAAADGSLLSSDKISQIAGVMFDGYRSGNVNQMFNDESACWNDAAKRSRADKALVAGCASAAMAGALIEATYARAQRRGPHPRYTGDAVRERIMKMSGLSQNETQSILDSTIEPNIGVILAGLKGAGMR